LIGIFYNLTKIVLLGLLAWENTSEGTCIYFTSILAAQCNEIYSYDTSTKVAYRLIDIFNTSTTGAILIRGFHFH